MLLVAMQLVFCFNRDGAIHETMAEYMSAMKAIEPNSTILPLCFDSWGTTLKRKPVSVRFHPFLRAAGQVAAERRALNLVNYERYYRRLVDQLEAGLDRVLVSHETTWGPLYGRKDLQPRAELKP